MTFKIVDDRYREESNETAELTDALLRGTTVFLGDVQAADVQLVYSRMLSTYKRRLRRRARTMDGVTGFVVWLDLEEVGA